MQQHRGIAGHEENMVAMRCVQSMSEWTTVDKPPQVLSKADGRARTGGATEHDRAEYEYALPIRNREGQGPTFSVA